MRSRHYLWITICGLGYDEVWMDRLDLPDEVHHVGSSFLNNNIRGDISQEDVPMISGFEHFLMVFVGVSNLHESYFS
jgi:hypothetical protein